MCARSDAPPLSFSPPLSSPFSLLGIVFLGDCPREPKIPIFLVVGGLSGVLKNVALVFENIAKHCSHRIPPEAAKRVKYAKYTWRVINLLFNLFMLSWIIAGSYWVYHIFSEVDPEYEDCDEILYKFAFGVITSSYILLVMMLCCTSCCGLCLIRRRAAREEEEEEEEEVEEEEGEGGGEEGREEGEGEEGSNERRSLSSAVGSPQDCDNAQISSRHFFHNTEPTAGSAVGSGSADSSQRPTPRNLEPLEVTEYGYSPIMSPRPRPLATDEQGSPQSNQSTSV